MSTTTEPRSDLDLPPGWERVKVQTVGPFVTAQTLRRPDGSTVAWRSRTRRKARPAARALRAWWQPRRSGWWIALLFALGSTCFLVAAVASQVQPTPGSWIGVTYFAGSLAFTSAAYLQFSETVNVSRHPAPMEHSRRWRPASWEPGRIDWLAASIQLAGTIFFNISTFAAMNAALDVAQVDRRVWAPDVFGSICFLLASELAFAEVCQRWACLRERTLSWWIVALNLGGSIAFGISAIAAVVLPSTGEELSAALCNVTTALGALGFLLGALLLIPESRAADAEGRAVAAGDA